MNERCTCMVYGELGLFSIEMHWTQRVLTFWGNIVMSKKDKICNNLYNLMFKLSSRNLYNWNWIDFVKNKLEEWI